MILPVFEYCDFSVESGPPDPVKHLQTIQNHCLSCAMGIVDPRLISRVALHVHCTCKWLARRRHDNLMGLIYKHSRVPDNLVVPVHVLRSNTKMKFRLQRPKGQRYQNSPLYRGWLLWDKLLGEEQETVSYSMFINKLKNK